MIRFKAGIRQKPVNKRNKEFQEKAVFVKNVAFKKIDI